MPLKTAARRTAELQKPRQGPGDRLGTVEREPDRPDPRPRLWR